MNEVIYKVLEAIMYVVELGIFYFWMVKNCGKRNESWLVQFVLFIVVNIVIYINASLEITRVIQVMINIIIMLVYAHLAFKTQKYQYIIYTFLYSLLLAIGDAIGMGVIGILYPEIKAEQLMTLQGPRYQFGVASKLFLVAVVLIFIHIKEKDEDEYSRGHIRILLCVFTISYICVCGLVGVKQTNTVQVTGVPIDLLLCMVSLGFFVVNMTTYALVKKLNYKLMKEKEHALVQCQIELLNKMVLENKEIEREWRKSRHDFNNHLSCIDMLLQMENLTKARNYIQNLNNTLQEHSYSIYTGNEIADAVINQKLVGAQKEQIHFTVLGEITSKFYMEDMDLCALLSNGIDNAIEANCQIEDEAQRYIEILLHHTDRHMQIEIKNAVKENIAEGRKLETTKKDTKRHGIGMMSMETTARKYNGQIKWTCNECQFHLHIEIPLA